MVIGCWVAGRLTFICVYESDLSDTIVQEVEHMPGGRPGLGAILSHCTHLKITLLSSPMGTVLLGNPPLAYWAVFFVRFWFRF
jgi:hypothetical protein